VPCARLARYRAVHPAPQALAAAGLRPHDAIAAGSWAARGYLGLGGLTPGAPADAVIYDADPRADLSLLDAPRAVILRGRLIHRR
jgi:imidazolonepropionase-like amidohydrolase